MQAVKVLKEILARERFSGTEVSKILGKNRSYIGNIFSSGATPHVENMATILDAVGYDLIARSRDDGYEFTIDPK